MKCKHGEPIPSTFGCNGCDAEKAQRKADNLQRREYAKAALNGLLSTGLDGESGITFTTVAARSFHYAAAMLTEQKKREAAE